MNHRSRLWLWLPVLALIIAGATRLRFDIEVLNLLPAGSPAVQGLKLYQQNFSNARELIVTVHSPDAESAERFARLIADTLRAKTNLVAEVTAQAPWLENPIQAAELAGYLWFNQPPAVFQSLIQRLLGPDAQETLAHTRERLTTSLSPMEMARLSHDPYDLLQLPEASPSLGAFQSDQDLFSSADGRFRLVFIQALNDLRSYRECQRWLAQIQAQVSALQAAQPQIGPVRIGYTGRPAFVSEIAGGMEHDINSSIAGTLLIIVLLFWWAHRRWRPLLWLVALLTLILGGTLALGGLFLGPLNVVSAGFAAILLGLAVDYALVLYQEHRAAPEKSAAEIRRTAGPSIAWSALTTAGAFLILNLGGLPGLAQLGSLVGVGISLAAVVILFGFLPPLMRVPDPLGKSPGHEPGARLRTPVFSPSVVWAITAVLLLGAGAILLRWPPRLDRTPDALRPRHSAAYQVLDEIRTEMKQEREPFWLVISGQDEKTVAERLDDSLIKLTRARAAGQIEDFTLPASIWPHPQFQAENRPLVAQLLQARQSLEQAALAAGFTPPALSLTAAVFDTWKAAAQNRGVFWPTNGLSRWVLGKFTAKTNDQFLALGLIYPASHPPSTQPQDDWMHDFARSGTWLASWPLLGDAVLEVVERDLWHVLVPMGVLLLVSLRLAFQRLSEMLLSLATLALSSLGLLAVMPLAGWSWNLLNLLALPLLLGAGVDYSIHMQLALRRHGGDVAAARRIIGRALFLCAATTVTGFGSLAWSRNSGLASLGQVCATGIGLTFLVSVWLLPSWWLTFHGPVSSAKILARSELPSSLYRTELWRLGHWAAFHLPGCVARWLCHLLAGAYWRLNRRRREVVIANLLPGVAGDQAKAEELSRELFRQFALKIADLWRYESGRPIRHLIHDLKGWDYFAAALQRSQGILLLTPHLGNWELGAPLLAARGVKLTVITLHEPQSELTELRKSSRSRWGIETLVIGENPFVFVDVIRRLEAGGTVALLIDRPPVSSSTVVTLFNRPFLASIAAAELARASGCVLLPVILPRIDAGYRAEVLPEIVYNRAALGSRSARAELTQEIVRAFEPVIQQHLAQWYHFVPIWRDNL